MAEEDGENEDKGGGGASTGKIIVLVLVGGLFIVATTVGAMFFMLKSMGVFDKGGQQVKVVEVEKEKKPAIYHTLEPIVVNINDNGRIRFLQAKMDVMARSQEAIDAVQQHMPRIRNELVLLLSNQSVDTVSTPEGKEKIRKEALARIQAVLEEELGEPGVEEVFITSLIVQ